MQHKVDIASLFVGVCLIAAPAKAQNALTQVVVEATTSIAMKDVQSSQGSAATSALMPVANVAAPGLTRIFISNVCTVSTGSGCESISSGQTSTANTYSGPNVYTFVWEIGYGSGQIAHQGGAQIANTYLVGKVPVCISGSQYTTSCPAGSTISGYRYEWNNGYYLNQSSAQNFAAQDTSQNSPYNTLSTGINIKYVSR